MKLKANFKVLYPEKIEMELTVTMSLEDWKRLGKQLPNEFPSYRLMEQIADMTRKAEKHFKPKGDKE